MNNRTALVIIDVQQGMFDFQGFGPVSHADLLNNINTLAKRARSVSSHVIYIQHHGGSDHPLEKGSAGHQIADQIAPLPSDHIVAKTQCGMFTETGLEQVLNELEITKLVICGMQTEFCVDTGVRTAADRGYDIIVAKDAHATFDTALLSADQIAQHHEALWAQAFGKVIPCADIKFKEQTDAPAT